MELYEWQKKIRDHKGNVTIRGGRQSGKSEAVADRIVKIANEYSACKILIIAASERQENYLIEKVRERLGSDYKFKSRATLTKLHLRNDTVILKYPVGKTGKYLEGLSSVDFLFADEAIFIPTPVWNSILPMLAEPSSRGLGWITLLSNTRAKPKGYFYESFNDPSFEKIHIKTSDCPHVSKEFLASEKRRLGESLYKVIYDGEFSEEGYKVFARELIDECATFHVWSFKDFNPRASYYLGIDPARFGRSKAAFCVAEFFNDKVKIVYEEAIAKSSLNDLKWRTEELDAKFNFKKIFIDDGGVGAGLVDMLDNMKRKIRRLNNSEKGIGGKILKEDLYSNAERLFELRKIEIPNKEQFLNDLKAVYFGDEDQIVGTDRSEAFVRACWCVKEKGYRLKAF